MKPQSAKEKGRRLCKRVKELLDSVFGFADGDVRVTSSGAPGEDLLLSPHAQKMFPYAIECKNRETLPLWKSWDQARKHAASTKRAPLLIAKRNGSEILAIVSLDDFVTLTKKAILREENSN